MNKKIVLTTALFILVMVTDTFADTDVSLLNVNRYFSYFSIKKKEDIADSDYVWEAKPEDMAKFGNLAGTVLPDTPLEFALLSYYSQPVLNIRPLEANAILPANNPKLADTKLGAAVFQEIQILRFLGDTAAVSRHEAVLKWITDRKNATRAEIEAFYRDNVRGLISAVVDEEFNKISFLLENYSTNSKFSYNAVLTRNPQNGEYKLSYERPDIPNSKKELSALSLETLLSTLQNSGDFVPTAINAVKAQAALIPAVALSDAALDEAKTILTNFYITPSATTYNAVKEVHTLFIDKRVATGKVIYWLALLDYVGVLEGLNAGLAKKVTDDKNNSVTALSADQQKRLVQLR